MRFLRTAFLSTTLAFAPLAMADTVSQDASASASDESGFVWTPQDGDVISFNVLRKGKPFGTHTVSFSGDADGTLQARSLVELTAKFGPITVFQYDLDTTETWQDGALVALEGTGDNDGKEGYVSAKLEGDVLKVKGSAYTGNAPADITPSSHWNIDEVRSDQILSTETGALLDVKVTKIGNETVSVGNQSVQADHYRLVSDLTVDLWYDDQGRWVKLSFETRGQQIDYILNELY